MSGDVVCIVAGGWSASAIDLKNLPGFVIAVNEPAILIRCDAAVTMDRLWMENRWPIISERKIETWARTAALKNIKDRPDFLHPFECDHKSTEMSEFTDRLNGTNSGFCALNLAYHMRPKTVYLFGFDMGRSPDGRAYWWGKGYPWARKGGGTGNTRYDEWADQFKSAAAVFQRAGISVKNVSATSAIQVFARITPKQFETET